MAATRFDELTEEVRALSPEEQRRLRDLLDRWLGYAELSIEEREEELKRRLVAKGLVRRIPPPITDFAPYRDWRPVEIEGEPLSETIVRERR